MSLQETITSKLDRGLGPVHLEVLDESHMHSVAPGAASHFRLLVVSAAFEGRSRLDRHRAIHRLLTEELEGGIHALAVDAFTPAEWEEQEHRGGTSPRCRGGSKQA
jgi:BolA protein